MRSADEAEKLGVAALPETAAEAAGFAKSTTEPRVFTWMVDVGAMTLDVCTFRLGQTHAAADLYGLLAAQVRPLGVEAYHWFLGDGKKGFRFAAQCDRCLREVVWRTRIKRDPMQNVGKREMICRSSSPAEARKISCITGSSKPSIRGCGSTHRMKAPDCSNCRYRPTSSCRSASLISVGLSRGG